MNKEEYHLEMDKIVNEDCKKIMAQILDLYKKKIEVNKSFSDLVRERINPKYLYLLESYYTDIVKMIPRDLYICPNGRWALVDEEDFNEIIFSKDKLLDSEKKIVSDIVSDVVSEFIEDDNADFFDVINRYIEPFVDSDNEFIYSDYVVDEIFYEIEKRGYTITSITPLKVEVK